MTDGKTEPQEIRVSLESIGILQLIGFLLRLGIAAAIASPILFVIGLMVGGAAAFLFSMLGLEAPRF